MSRYDVVVIGAGLAGLTTACLLARANKKVLLIASGGGVLLLASGCIDVLGFQPSDSREPVADPLSTLDAFVADNPDHPYRLVGRDEIELGLESFWQLANDDAGLDYRGAANRNWLLPSAAGAVHPTCLAPKSLANGDLSKGGRMRIVGFEELRDFYPALISQNLNAQNLGVKTAGLTIQAAAPLTGQMNVTPIELARAFENESFRRQIVRQVKKECKGYSRIGFPAVLGLDKHQDVVSYLERELGKTVFEISTLPPSVPGRRLFEGLHQTFLKAGGRLIIGSKVVDGSIEQGRVSHIRCETASRLRSIKAKNYVLATGGIYGGGIQTDADGRVWEPIFGLPVSTKADRHAWFAPQFLSPNGQPVGQYGIRVNKQLNPLMNDADPVATNLFIAGAAIAGANWVPGRTGDGVAITMAAIIARQLAD